MSRICFANNTVAISKSNSSIKYNVLPTIMKYIVLQLTDLVTAETSVFSDFDGPHSLFDNT
jgi:hypothetical protein